MIASLITWVKHLREYIKRGGEVHFECSFVSCGQELKDRRILITGGSSGIGLAIAKRCLHEGAGVLITGRNLDKLKIAQRELATDKVHIMQWDINDVVSVDKNIKQAESILGGELDILVNNAGVSNRQTPEMLTLDAWKRIIDINLTGTLFVMKGMCDRWARSQRHGVILNIGSTAGVALAVDAYGASKSALMQLTRGWAKFYAPKGIRINALAPGVIVGTDINALQRSISTVGNLYCESYPSRRFGVPEEVAESALFLISDRSAYMFGQTLVLDGGATL